MKTQHIPVNKPSERDVREASFTYQIRKGVGMQQIQQALARMRPAPHPAKGNK